MEVQSRVAKERRRSEKNAVLFEWRFQADPYVMLACRPGGRKALFWRFERTWIGVYFGGEEDERKDPTWSALWSRSAGAPALLLVFTSVEKDGSVRRVGDRF